MESPQDRRMQYQQIVAKAWANEVYRQRLLRDPAGALRSEGVSVPEGVEVKVLEDTPKLVHFVLPVKPAGGGGEAEDFYIC
jgi:hypothetical protein